MSAYSESQQNSVGTLESRGFNITHWFPLDRDDESSPVVYCLSKRVSRFQSKLVQVDPDGTCNGVSLSDFLASL